MQPKTIQLHHATDRRVPEKGNVMDRRLMVLALGMFALGTDSYIVAGVLPQMARDFDVSVGAAGQLTTVYAITFALLAPTIAAIAAGVQRKTMLLSGLAVFVLANLGTAVAPTFALALLSRALAGVGAAMFSPTATGSAASIVAPERRGHALAIVIAGLSAATALGSPLGALIGGFGDWRWTMAFVAILAALALGGVAFFLSDIPLLPKISLKQRLAPLADKRIGLTLVTTLVAMSGIFTMYTYFAVVFDRAIGGSTLILSLLLVMWGVAGTFANVMAGRMIDAIGSRRVIVTCLVALMATFALAPWSSASVWTAIPAILIWGACGWGILVPQQHRLVTMVPAIAPILLGLNTACTYLGVTASAVIGAVGLKAVGAHNLGVLAAVLVVIALALSELAGRRIAEAETPQASAKAA
jgi:predicted MFS family arabinose efflux permease